MTENKEKHSETRYVELKYQQVDYARRADVRRVQPDHYGGNYCGEDGRGYDPGTSEHVFCGVVALPAACHAVLRGDGGPHRQARRAGGLDARVRSALHVHGRALLRARRRRGRPHRRARHVGEGFLPRHKARRGRLHRVLGDVRLLRDHAVPAVQGRLYGAAGDLLRRS